MVRGTPIPKFREPRSPSRHRKIWVDDYGWHHSSTEEEDTIEGAAPFVKGDGGDKVAEASTNLKKSKALKKTKDGGDMVAPKEAKVNEKKKNGKGKGAFVAETRCLEEEEFAIDDGNMLSDKELGECEEFPPLPSREPPLSGRAPPLSEMVLNLPTSTCSMVDKAALGCAVALAKDAQNSGGPGNVTSGALESGPPLAAMHDGLARDGIAPATLAAPLCMKLARDGTRPQAYSTSKLARGLARDGMAAPPHFGSKEMQQLGADNSTSKCNPLQANSQGPSKPISGGNFAFPKPNAWASRSKKIFMNNGIGGKLEFTPPTSNRVSIKCSEALPKQSVWGWALLGQYVGFHPGFFKINELRATWGVKSRWREEEGWMIFNFDSEEDRDKVLKEGPYFIHGKPLILKHIPDKFAFNRKDVATIPLWVRIFGLAMDYWTPEILGRIASHVGKPLFTDPVTNGLKRGAYARVLCEINFASSFLREVFLDFDDGESLECKFLVENEPLYCHGCCSFGHNDETCSFKEKRDGKGVRVKKGPRGPSSGLPKGYSGVENVDQAGTNVENVEVVGKSLDEREPLVATQDKEPLDKAPPTFLVDDNDVNDKSDESDSKSDSERETESHDESGSASVDKSSEEEDENEEQHASDEESIASSEEEDGSDDSALANDSKDGNVGALEKEHYVDVVKSPPKDTTMKKLKKVEHEMTVIGLKANPKWPPSEKRLTRSTRTTHEKGKDKGKKVTTG